MRGNCFSKPRAIRLYSTNHLLDSVEHLGAADESARAESALPKNGGAVVPQAAAPKTGGGAFDLLGFLETSNAKADHPEARLLFLF